MDYLLASVSDPGDLVQTSSSSSKGFEATVQPKGNLEIQILTTEVSKYGSQRADFYYVPFLLFYVPHISLQNHKLGSADKISTTTFLK